MKITLKMDGGFVHIPALSRPVIIDTAQIDAQVAADLESWVHRSQFFDQPARGQSPAKGSADYRTYTITVQDGPQVHTIRRTEPIADTNLEQLVSNLRRIFRKLSPR